MSFSGRLLALIAAFLVLAMAAAGCSHISSLSDGPAFETGWEVIRPPSDIESIVAGDGMVWAGGKEGVFGIDPETDGIFATLSPVEETPYVQALVLDREGRLWVGFNGGVACYDGGIITLYTTGDGIADDRVNALIEDRGGRIFAGTWGGVSVFENSSWRPFEHSGGLLHPMVNEILEDRDGGLWFGSYVAPKGGVSVFSDGRWQYFSTENGLPHNNVNAIVQDRNGDVWVGTGLYDRGGAARLALQDSGWTIAQTLLKTDGLAGEKVRSIFEDSSGALWFGSEYDGLSVLANGRFTVISGEGSLSNPEVKCIAEDSGGTIWIGTRDGITKVPPDARGFLQ